MKPFLMTRNTQSPGPLFSIKSHFSGLSSNIPFSDKRTINCLFFRTAILGYKRSINRDDLWRLRDQDAAESVIPRWEKNWQKALEDQRIESRLSSEESGSINYRSIKCQECPSLMWNLSKTVMWQVIPALLYKLVGDLLLFVSPQILK